MFLINTTPLGSHKSLGDYGKFLIKRYIMPHLNRSTREVHVVFDNPGRLQNSPKYFEQRRRDANAKVVSDHCCDDFTQSTKIPPGKWREQFLNCRVCKRNLVKFLGTHFLHNIGPHLHPQQTLHIAGAFDDDITDTAWFVKGNASPQPEPALLCNAEEADTRMWLHVQQTQCKKVLLLLPDGCVSHRTCTFVCEGETCTCASQSSQCPYITST